MNLPGLQAPPRKRLGVHTLVFESPILLAEVKGRCAAGAATGPENPGRSSGREARHLHLPLPGTTQLVDGAALIQRYRQVRFLGARPHAAGVTENAVPS